MSLKMLIERFNRLFEHSAYVPQSIKCYHKKALYICYLSTKIAQKAPLDYFAKRELLRKMPLKIDIFKLVAA